MKEIKRASFFWNAIYSGINALQSAIILLAVSRKMDIAFAGILTIGFSIGNLSAIVARYGIRNYQVTDIEEEYSFSDYFHCRIITSTVAFFVSTVYIATMYITSQYTAQKGLIIFEIVLLKGVGAIEEVYVSRLQQQGRLDIGARIASIRIGTSTIIIFISIWLINNLLICILLGVVAEIVVDGLLIPSVRRYTSFTIISKDRDKVKKLIYTGLSLCIGTALHNYIGNGPKYLVDAYLTDDIQAICGYIMMPMFMLTVLNLFIMQPAVKGLGEAWSFKDKVLFREKAIKHISYIIVFSVFVLFFGYFIGLRVLTWMYKVNLLPYRIEFLILMVGGCFYTVTAYLVVLLITMRRQIGIVYGCCVALAIYLFTGKHFVTNLGLIGSCIVYSIANVSMLCVFLFCLLKNKGINICSSRM